MIFYALTSAGPRGRSWNPNLKGEGFNTARGAQQMSMNQKSMFDRYYCIKNILSLENFGKNLSKSSFSCTYNGAERYVTCIRFENAASRAKTNVILTSLNYVRYCARYWWWRQFLYLFVNRK